MSWIATEIEVSVGGVHLLDGRFHRSWIAPILLPVAILEVGAGYHWVRQPGRVGGRRSLQDWSLLLQLVHHPLQKILHGSVGLTLNLRYIGDHSLVHGRYRDHPRNRHWISLAVFSGKKYVSFVTDGGFSDCGEVDGGDSVAVRRVR